MRFFILLSMICGACFANAVDICGVVYSGARSGLYSTECTDAKDIKAFYPDTHTSLGVARANAIKYLIEQGYESISADGSVFARDLPPKTGCRN